MSYLKHAYEDWTREDFINYIRRLENNSYSRDYTNKTYNWVNNEVIERKKKEIKDQTDENSALKQMKDLIKKLE